LRPGIALRGGPAIPFQGFRLVWWQPVAFGISQAELELRVRISLFGRLMDIGKRTGPPGRGQKNQTDRDKTIFIHGLPFSEVMATA
jgi:hypothetical protein